MSLTLAGQQLPNLKCQKVTALKKTRLNKTFFKNSLIIDTEVDLNIENIIILEDHF